MGLLRELANRPVFDHAPAQRTHRLVGHGDAPVLSEVGSSSSSRQDAPVRYRVSRAACRSDLPRERFRPMALKRPSAPPPEGPLTEVLPTRNAWVEFVSP
jgi:hypothetical protein